jgi:hypothetical protein
MPDVTQEMLRLARQAVDGAVSPIALRLDMAPWQDEIKHGGVAHREEFWGGGGGLGLPWSSACTFGITDTSEIVEGDTEITYKLKVWKGKFRRSGDQTYHAADTEVTFTGDGDQWLVWRWSESSGLEIVTTPQVNYPAESDGTYSYGPIHKVNLTAGKFTLLDACQLGIASPPIFTVPGA